MPEIYRKRGSVVRYENGTIVHVREAGEASEDRARFRCAPSRGREALPERDPGALVRAAEAIRARVAEQSIERLVIVDGFAEHEFGGRTWTESTRRIHIALVSPSLRVLIDDAEFGTDDIIRIAEALHRAGAPRAAPQRLRLAPRVTAALIPALLDIVPPNCSIEQVAGGIDGKGSEIRAVTGPSWPNWYRPSYRLRPQRMPMNITLRCAAGVIDADLPRATALLAPADGNTLHVLCEHREEVFPTRLRITRIDAVSERLRWYPVSAGVWAGEAEVVSG